MSDSDFHLECRAEEASLHKRIDELKHQLKWYERLVRVLINKWRGAQARVSALEAENKILTGSIKAGGEVSKRGVKRIAELEAEVAKLRSRLALDDLLEERQEMESLATGNSFD